MLQAGLNFDLAHETVREIRLVLQIGQQDFHGFHAVRNGIADLKNLTHTAGAQDRHDLVIADPATDIQAHFRLTKDSVPYRPPWPASIPCTCRWRSYRPLQSPPGPPLCLPRA